jgi:4-hydroxy-4-methyl-2-oxoglutarate aldolase
VDAHDLRGVSVNRHIVIREFARPDPAAVQDLGEIGVATVHAAQRRTGLLASYLRPIYPGAGLAGPAVTVLVPPGDHCMIDVAVEVCRPGDVLLVAPSNPCSDGYVGELLATALKARGVKAVIIDAGVRDLAALTEMRFPVWSKCISAHATLGARLGAVNVPVTCAGQTVSPGDVIVADDDGVVAVKGEDAVRIADAAARLAVAQEEERARLAAGELGIDIHRMREKLAALGLEYLDRAPDG